MGLIDHPYIYIGFISLHLLAGQGVTGFFYWLRFGKSPVIVYQEKPNNRHHFISQCLILPVVLWFSCICLYAFSQGFRSYFSVLNISPLYGWIIALIGLIGMLLCQYQMGEAFRVGQEPKEECSQNRLNTQGFFKYSRNPIYFFSILYLIGVSLWIIIWPIWLALIIIITLIHCLVLEEEQFLSERFTDEYLEYKKSVPRYIGLSGVVSHARK